MPVSNPNFGTGAVDWGNYVGANQGTINRDRSQVQAYLQAGTPPPTTINNPYPNLPQQLGQGLGNLFNGGQPSTTGGQGVGAAVANSSAAPVAPDWSAMNSALATPGGFEQDLGAANYPSLTTAYGSLPANGPTATHPGAGNNFDAALEGQNAMGLAGTGTGAPPPTAGNVAPGFKTTAAPFQVNNTHSGPNAQGPAGPGIVGGGPSAWQQYLQHQQKQGQRP